MAAGLVAVLERLAARHGVTIEEGSVRRAQVRKWLEDLGPSISDGAERFIEQELDKLEKWPKWSEFRDACRIGRKAHTASAWGAPGDVCRVCRATGWASYTRQLEAGGHRLPWAGVCLCAAGDRLASRYLRVDRDLFDDLRRELSESSSEAPAFRRVAALAYIRVAIGRDPEPLRMVEAILEGRRDDVARTLVDGDSVTLAN